MQVGHRVKSDSTLVYREGALQFPVQITVRHNGLGSNGGGTHRMSGGKGQTGVGWGGVAVGSGGSSIDLIGKDGYNGFPFVEPFRSMMICSSRRRIAFTA